MYAGATLPDHRGKTAPEQLKIIDELLAQAVVSEVSAHCPIRLLQKGRPSLTSIQK